MHASGKNLKLITKRKYEKHILKVILYVFMTKKTSI